MLMVCIELVLSDSTIKDGIYFKKEREVIYSNSEWIVTTEVSFGHLVTNIGSLRNYLVFRTWNTKIPTPSLEQGKPFRMQARLSAYGQQAANDCLMTLDVLEGRLLRIINSTAGARDPEDEDNRKRRGAFNLGADVFKWVFGTPNNNDLENLHKRLSESKKLNSAIVHSIEEQALLVTENFRHAEANSKKLSEIKNTNQLRSRIF